MNWSVMNGSVMNMVCYESGLFFAFSLGLWQWLHFLLVPGIAENWGNYSYCSSTNESIWG